MNIFAKLGTAAALVVAAFVFGRHVISTAESRGAERVRDSAALATRTRLAHVADSATHHTDSLNAIRVAALRDSARVQQSRADQKALDDAPRIVVSQPLKPVTMDFTPMMVYVESDKQSYPAHPKLGKLLVWYDSLVWKVAPRRIGKLLTDSAHADHVITAFYAERTARDSVLAAWKQRVAVLESRRPSKVKGLAVKVAWAGAGYLVGRAVR